MREAQRLTLGLPNTGMASAIDIGNPDDIHPLNKQEVGRRLALAARAVAYGERIVSSGPALRRHDARRAPKVRIRFSHVGGGLVLDTAKGSGFTVAGVDGVFKPATAVVDGDTLVVSSAGRRRAGGGPLRLGGQPGDQPPQQGRAAGVAVPHRHLRTLSVRRLTR